MKKEFELELKVMVFESIKNGATVFGDIDAYLIQIFKREYDNCIKILDVQELEEIKVQTDYHGSKAHFGAILTTEGKKKLREFKKIIKRRV